MSRNNGVSKTLFVTGIIIAILASSALSTVIVTQLAVGPEGPAGPQGLKGEEGNQGIQGMIGPQGPQGVTGPKEFKDARAPGGFGAPDYDSGWLTLTTQETEYFTHNLGTTDNLFVYLYGRAMWMGQWLYHQDHLGTDSFFSGEEYSWVGASWFIVTRTR